MWWYLRKKIDNTDIVVYTYGFETHEQSGEISFNRKTEEFNIIKIAKNDTQKGAERLLPHLWRVIFTEKCPDERLVAIG